MAKLPTNSKDRKDVPVFTGFMAYFPLAIVEVAKLSLASNEKHNPGQPLHWSKEISNDHADCLVRHQLEHNQVDPSDGFYHDVKVAWRAMAQLQIRLEGGPLAQVLHTNIKILNALKMGLSVSLNGDVFKALYSKDNHKWLIHDQNLDFLVNSEDFRLGYVEVVAMEE